MRTVAAFSIGIIAVGSSCLARRPPVCSALTPANIVTLTGVASDSGIPYEITDGKGVTSRTCMYLLHSRKGTLTIFVGPKPSEATAAASSEKNTGTDTLEAQQATLETKDYGSTQCTIMSMPATNPIWLSTSCLAEAKGQSVMVMWVTSGQKLEVDRARELLDTVIARVH